MIRKLAKLLVCIALLPTSLATASLPSTSTPISGWAMEMPYEITLNCPITSEKRADLEKKILDVFEKVHTIFSNFNESSEISKFNRLKANKRMSVSKELYDCIKFCKEMNELTEGHFDPSIATAITQWKSALKSGMVLPAQTLETLKQHGGIDKVHLEAGAIYKTSDHLQIDLCGVAKGIAVDWLQELLKKEGVPGGLINWAGEIAAFGVHAEGRPWRVMIPANAFSGSALDIEEGALATSGDYLQNWQVTVKDKVMAYSHIIDPKSLSPLEIKPGTISSVSVFAQSCQLADVLATSAMFYTDNDKLSKWIQKVKKRHPKTHFWVLKRKGNQAS